MPETDADIIVLAGDIDTCLDYGDYIEDNVRFPGATLWTDYNTFMTLPKEQVMFSIENGLADHRKIPISKNGSYK
ncbi:MAG: hypothetical protein OQK98_02745 [Gammaproteobacteria bacterium]|nr:hypothetical protein [Gammaproteobacteria bacterium]